MINWNFDPNNVKETSFEIAPIGARRIRIEDVEETFSKSGLPMWKFTFKPSEGYSNLFWYLVFDNNNQAMVNTNLSALWNSFGLQGAPTTQVNKGFFVGKIGACKVKHEDYNGEPQARVHYLISRDKQATLPQFVESKQVQAVTGNNPFNLNDDAPF